MSWKQCPLVSWLQETGMFFGATVIWEGEIEWWTQRCFFMIMFKRNLLFLLVFWASFVPLLALELSLQVCYRFWTTLLGTCSFSKLRARKSRSLKSNINVQRICRHDKKIMECRTLGWSGAFLPAWTHNANGFAVQTQLTGNGWKWFHPARSSVEQK